MSVRHKFLWAGGIFLPIALFLAATPLVHAATYDARIRALQSQNNQSQAQKKQLQQQALPLQQQVASLNGQIASIEEQIGANETKRDQLVTGITQAEADLAHQRSILGENIRKMYIESGMSTLEMLATSEDLSHYVDKEQYQTSLRQQVENSLKRIDALKKELDAQKILVDKLLADQQVMRDQVASQRAEVATLLNYNQSQQAEYDKAIKSRTAEISELERKQAVENARYNVGKAVKGGTGGYPYANAPWPNSIVDPWGMYQRQCVSYTAWKVARSGRHMPYWGGFGNAKNWDDNARAEGIPVDRNPQVGDVAVSNAGTYGHVMYVEEVHGDGTITVSQYNAGWDGEYSVATRSIGDLVFIHF